MPEPTTADTRLDLYLAHLRAPAKPPPPPTRRADDAALRERLAREWMGAQS